LVGGLHRFGVVCHGWHLGPTKDGVSRESLRGVVDGPW